MLRSFDVVLIGVMVTAAVVTYTIKHKAELKLEEVRRLEAEIRLEKDTIDLLKADWALLTQPSRLQRLIAHYSGELKLAPTLPTQLARPNELPMLKAQLPHPPGSDEGMSVEAAIAAAAAPSAGAPIRSSSASRPGGIPVPLPRGGVGTDDIETGSVNR